MKDQIIDFVKKYFLAILISLSSIVGTATWNFFASHLFLPDRVDRLEQRLDSVSKNEHDNYVTIGDIKDKIGIK